MLSLIKQVNSCSSCLVVYFAGTRDLSYLVSSDGREDRKELFFFFLFLPLSNILIDFWVALTWLADMLGLNFLVIMFRIKS